MWFTEAEAKAQHGKWVRVRDASLGSARIDKGAHGQVVSTQPAQPGERGKEEAGWGICIEVYLSHDHSLSVLLHNVSKGQYAGTFEEIPAQSSPRPARIAPCAHTLPRHSALARHKILTLVSSNGPTKQRQSGAKAQSSPAAGTS
jgi:hypothetical protein